MLRILIADNELALVVKLEAFLAARGYDMVGNAVSGRQAVEMAVDLKPDVVLMDIKLSGEMNGITAAEKIKSIHDIPIIFLTWNGDEKSLRKAGRIHPDGYVLKPFQAAQVQAAIKVALDHQNRDRSPSVPQAGKIDGTLQKLSDNGARTVIPVLTPAEMRVAHLIKEGKRTRDIARHLKLSPSTVSWHHKHIRRKIGVTGNNTKNLMGSLFSLGPFFSSL